MFSFEQLPLELNPLSHSMNPFNQNVNIHIAIVHPVKYSRTVGL